MEVLNLGSASCANVFAWAEGKIHEAVCAEVLITVGFVGWSYTSSPQLLICALHEMTLLA